MLLRSVFRALSDHPAIYVRIVDRTIYETAFKTMLRCGDRHDLPISEMSRDEQDALSKRNRPRDQIYADDLDSRIRSVEKKFVEMRIFRNRAAEIVPHLKNGFFYLGQRHFWECRNKISLRSLRD